MTSDALSTAERVALEWLLDGNGQKFISPGRPYGPFAAQHGALIDTHRDLERRRLVEVGHPSYHGTRSVNITNAGRAALAAVPTSEATPEGDRK